MTDTRSPTPQTGAGSFDFVVVGAGTAGCVLASRLSADPACKVLLVEAGDDVAPGREPADILSSSSLAAWNPGYRWPVPAYLRTPSNSRRGAAPQARILGGGSSVMGMIALRGLPDDYDEWAAGGAQGWSWAEVLPWFRALEQDVDFDGPLHGADGPTVVRRNPRAGWPPLCRAAQAYGARLGLPDIGDMNGDFREGFASLPLANLVGRRQSASICYLDDAVRARPNLCILTQAQVTGLVEEQGVFCGVELLRPGGRRSTHRAGEVILCAGALLSPALLMRAGIGPRDTLERLGIPVRAERRGVGANLQNHPMLFMSALLPRRAREHDGELPSINCCFRYSSEGASHRSDLYIQIANRTATHKIGRQLANFQSYLLRPESRGRVRLLSTDPLAPPEVEFNFMSDPADLRRSVQSLRDMARIATSPEMRAFGAEFFAVKFSDRLRSLNENTPANRLLSFVAGTAHDWLPGAAALINRTMGGGPSAGALLAGAVDLEQHVHAYVSPSGHHAGTCRMGAAGDPDAVVSPTGEVHGVRGLRVVDASIMPRLPRGNTNLPTLMLAEKLAAEIASGKPA